MRNMNVRLAAFAVAGLAAVFSGSALAGGSSSSYVDSKGGITISDADQNYWFRLGSRLQFDAVRFDGSASDLVGFASGTNVRRAFLDLSGGVGDHWVYRLLADFAPSGVNTVSMRDAYIGYTGFNNAYVSVGQTSVPFGLEDAMDNGDSLFMERSLMSSAIKPGFDIGVYGDMQFDKFSVMGGIYTPNDDVTQTSASASDPLLGAARVVFAPVNTSNEVWHFGASGLYAQNHRNSSVTFSTVPEMTSRSTATLSTGAITGVQDYQLYGLEAAFKRGPWYAGTEYQTIHVDRDASYGTDLNFRGYSLMASYIITGESRSYDSRMGSFGGVKPASKHGAWDVSARYSMAKLGTGPVGNGTEHNFTLGTSWWYNSHVRFLANYVRASKPTDVDLNIVGVRAQVVW